MENLEKYGLSHGDNVVMKVGSSTLAGNAKDKDDIDFGINHKNVQNVVNSVDYLMQLGLNVFLVSSGAVAIGKREFEKNGIVYGDELSPDDKAFLSGNGQIILMNLYYNLFKEKNILITQNLLTHNNFTNKNIFTNLQNVWQQNIKNRTLAIINENDTISREELKFSDNDQLAGYVAKAINAKLLILLSDVDGVSKNFGKENQELIREVTDVEIIRIYSNREKKEGNKGTGGMDTKLNVFEEMLKNGINGILTNGSEENIIQKIIEGFECKRTVFRV